MFYLKHKDKNPVIYSGDHSYMCKTKNRELPGGRVLQWREGGPRPPLAGWNMRGSLWREDAFLYPTARAAKRDAKHFARRLCLPLAGFVVETHEGVEMKI